MPLYEYRCLKCGHVIEVLQKLSDRPPRKCGVCSGKLEKLISRTSFQLKGGGWFAHGYGGPSGSEDAKSDKAESSSTEDSGGSSKGESKPKKKKKSKATG